MKNALSTGELHTKYLQIMAANILRSNFLFEMGTAFQEHGAFIVLALLPQIDCDSSNYK
jgi:hypothetical protein